jgi:hypothetical protein
MGLVNWTVCSALALLGGVAHAQSRSLLVDAGEIRGNIHVHTETSLDRRLGPSEGDDAWARFGEIAPDRVVIPLALGSSDTATVLAADQAWPVFPNENADPQDPASYDFRAVDGLVQAAVSHAVGLVVRLYVGPAASESGGRIAEAARRVVMHFNDGWAQGHGLAIQEWQLCGTGILAHSSESEAIDEAIANALKRHNRSLRVGRCIGWPEGPNLTNSARQRGSAGGVLDFLAWRFPMPTNDPYDALRLAQTLRQQLDGAGLAESELRLRDSVLELDGASSDNSGATTAAFLGAALVYLQDAPVESVPLDLWIEATGSLQNKRRAVLRAISQMSGTPYRLPAVGGDTIGYAVLAGRSADRSRIQILIANYQRKRPGLSASEPAPGAARGEALEPKPPSDDAVVYPDEGYDLQVSNLPWGAADFGVYRYRIDARHDLDLLWEGGGRGGSLRLREHLPAPGVELIVLQQEDRPVTDRLPRRRGRQR